MIVKGRLYNVRLGPRPRRRLLTPLSGHDCVYLAFGRVRVVLGLKVRMKVTP